MFIFAYSWIDVQLQITDEERIKEANNCDEVRKKAQLSMMKVVHDLKNPILAIEELVEYEDDVSGLEFKENKKIKKCKSYKFEKNVLIKYENNQINKIMSNLDICDEFVSKSKICSKCMKILNQIKCEIKFETTDLLEMFENLKTSFKLGQGMEIVEEKINIPTHEIVQSIGYTHKKLAINGFNE